MKIKWLGQSCFLITTGSGIRIITDPYTPDAGMQYGEIKETADIVTVSHEHFDHNNVEAVKGNPIVLRKSGEARGISFKAIAAFHDEVEGRQRGKDTLFCFTVDGVKICHLGDLGHIPDKNQLAEMGAIDVLLIPAGGFFTLEPDAASKVIDLIKPKVAIPMHYKTEKTSMPFTGIDNFLKGKRNFTRLNVSEVELKAGLLPSTTTIMVLQPAL